MKGGCFADQYLDYQYQSLQLQLGSIRAKNIRRDKRYALLREYTLEKLIQTMFLMDS